MTDQYPLPAGYPPPGATYNIDQPTVPPIGFNPAPFPQHDFQPPQMDGVGQPPFGYAPPPAAGGYSADMGQPFSPGPPAPVAAPSASYAPVSLTDDGSLGGAAALPYGAQPDQPVAHAGTHAAANTAGVTDPILLAEMNAAADVMADIKKPDPTPSPALPPAVYPAINTDSKSGGDDARPFYLVSETSDKLVLGVHKDSSKPGAAVGVHKKKATATPGQQWYVGAEGYLRSKIDGLALEAQAKKELHTSAFTGDSRQQWTLEGNKITNKSSSDECLTVKKGIASKVKGGDADVIAAPYEGKPGQHWKQVFCD